MNRSFFRNLLHEFKQIFQGLIVSFKGHKDSGLLISIEGIKWIHCFSILKAFESIHWLIAIVLSHTQISPEDSWLRINLNSLVKVLLSLLKLLLLQTNVSNSPPCIVMSLIRGKSFLITSLSLVKIFISNIFMTTEGVSIGKVIIQLDGSVEELKSSFMLLL